MDSVAIVSTSINASPSAYKEWSLAGKLIVAGDQNAPAELERFVTDECDGSYLSPAWQDSMFSFSKAIGWKCIQRRNTAIMHAFAASDYDYILTVDDDNAPRPTAQLFVDGHVANIRRKMEGPTVGTVTNFLNTGMFCLPKFHQRGVPYGIDTETLTYMRTMPEIVVAQAQVLGDPDCDAVERICHAPNVMAVSLNVVVSPGTYAAFNSQATMWKRDWAPVMAVLPGIGRYDDIFASFIFARMAREYNTAVYVGEPVVYQSRNEHDLARDLRAENWGMRNVFEFIGALNAAHISSQMPLWMAYGELISATSSVLPPRTVDFANEWVRTWREVVGQ